MRVDYALRQHEQWYKGDGIYGDGPVFHWDYYNSFVIQPMLLDVLDGPPMVSGVEGHRHRVADARETGMPLFRNGSSVPTALPAHRPFARVSLRRVSSSGAPALRKALPEGVSPEQVRCALTAVIRRTLEAPGTFDENGWLQIGFCGHQPGSAKPTSPQAACICARSASCRSACR